jgi:predicted alpha/beta-fold hydrolase
MINAEDDPFLGRKCYPLDMETDFFKIEIPKYGGHVGFYENNIRNLYWSEKRAQLFISEILSEKNQ